jgi:hypothetical protein
VTGCPTNAELEDDPSAVVVAAATTDCVNGWLLVAKLVSPEYVAVTGWVAGERYVAEQVALPPPIVFVLQPVIVVPLSLKANVPVGEPLPGEVTLIDAVYVTGCPTTDEIEDEMSVVVVRPLVTVIAELPPPLLDDATVVRSPL